MNGKRTIWREISIEHGREILTLPPSVFFLEVIERMYLRFVQIFYQYKMEHGRFKKSPSSTCTLKFKEMRDSLFHPLFLACYE